MFEGELANLLNTHTPMDAILLRMLAAFLLGGIIGLDREFRKKPAGLRTNMLVAIASASFTLLGLELIHDFADEGPSISADPVRIIYAIITGVAFLGAGTIIHGGGSVRGITSGAAVWISGSIGLACGAGDYAIGGLTTLFAVITLSLIGRLEGKSAETQSPQEHP